MTDNATAPIKVNADELSRWATGSQGPVAIHVKQKLLPVTANENEQAIIYPPTYADIGYCIDELSDNKKVALIDSVGSQANRMEPIFKQKFGQNGPDENGQYLVPPIEIKLNDNEKRSLLDLAHRSADAVVQSCPTLLHPHEHAFDTAFRILKGGDAGPLCALAPTSLIFGVWDSRGGSGEKRPRLVRSIIRAWDVDVLHAAAQFNSIWKALDESQRDELIKEEAKKDMQDLSDVGLNDAPAVFRKTKIPEYQRDGLPDPEARVLGGVLVCGRIEREVTVNLVALRNLRGATPEETAKIQKYLLGLALIAATNEIDLFLREGCHLRYATTDDDWYLVPRRGTTTRVDLGSTTALATILKFTLDAVNPFREKWPQKLEHQFVLEKAKKLLVKKDKGKKKSKKSKPTNEEDS